jgi:glycosyltransferase involved in cell wall biosynthesis
MKLSEAPISMTDKRLLVILTSLCAEGTPVLALEMCRRWKAAGISPTVATMTRSPSDLESEFHAAGIPIEQVELPMAGNLRFPSLAWAMFRLCRRLRPQAVLSMPLGWHAFTFMGARAAGVRSTAAHAGNYPPIHDGSTLAKFRFLVQLARPVTDTLICCSSYVERAIQEHFRVPGSHTTVIYNGVDVTNVVARAQSARLTRPRDGRFVVGMVARLEIHKDQSTLIRAAALLREASLRVEIWLVGEGSRRQEYDRLIADLGVGDRVKLLGMRRDVPELLGQMDAFVFSAKPDEGLGVALIEAMAAGVPIIATDVGACQEVLEKGALGQLVPEGDAGAMAAAILRQASRPEEDLVRLEAAKARALQVFSIDEMAQRYARCLGLS